MAMTTVQAKALIFDSLCFHYQKTGKNEYVDAKTVQDEQGLSENILAKALYQFTNSESHLMVEAELETGRLKLGRVGLTSCTSKPPVNPYRT